MIIHRCEQGSEAWYELKAGRITGTSFSTLMSAESTQGYKTLVNKIAGEIISGKSDENDQGYTNDLMEYALEMEPEAISEYENITGNTVDRVGFVTPDEGTEFAEWIGCSPDGIIDSLGIEVKCPLMKTHIGYIEEQRLPTEYRHQVQGSMFVTGFNLWIFMSYYPGLKPFIIIVEKDAELHDQYAEKLRSFIAKVNQKIEIYKNYDYLK